MKQVLTSMIVCIAFSAKAQTFDEWFKQKSTQKKYLLEQIAALQVYHQYVQKGTSILRQGTDLIGKIKDGDLNLHGAHFQSLRTVNPAIAKYPRIQDIFYLYASIVKEMATANHSVLGPLYDGSERKYVQSVFASVNKTCDADMDELKKVISNGQLELKDDERIIRIDNIFERMKTHYAFVHNFSRQITAVRTMRQQEIKNVQQLKKLHGIK